MRIEYTSIRCECINCGDQFELDKFQAPVTEPWKPAGGLWACPVGIKDNWENWCDWNQPDWIDDTSFEFTVAGPVLVIDSLDDLEDVPFKSFEQGLVWTIDVEQIAETCAAIHLTSKGHLETAFSQPYNLYGWDCETVLVLDPRCIV